MNKELTPLEAFYELGDNTPITDTWKIVETTLKDYETRKTLIETIDSGEMVFEERNVWEEKQKKLKALEIIKEKQVSVADFIYACMCSAKDLKEYHNCDSNYEFAATCVGWGKEYLTKEEYELLKDVLVQEKQ